MELADGPADRRVFSLQCSANASQPVRPTTTKVVCRESENDLQNSKRVLKHALNSFPNVEEAVSLPIAVPLMYHNDGTFVVLRVVSLKQQIFCGVTPCRFEGRLHHQNHAVQASLVRDHRLSLRFT